MIGLYECYNGRLRDQKKSLKSYNLYSASTNGLIDSSVCCFGHFEVNGRL